MKHSKSGLVALGECKQELLFEVPVGKVVKARFDGGAITSDAGFLLLRAADDKVCLSRALNGALRDRRQAGKVRQPTLSMLRERIYGIASGYPDANDHDTLCHDAALKLSCDRLPGGASLASQPTLSRLENRVKKADLLRLGLALAERVIAQLPANTQSVILDVDASDDPCHGQQEFEFFNGYYDSHCFVPLFLHLQEEDGRQWPLAELLRHGKAGATLGLRFLLKHAVRLLRARFAKIKITLRGDAAYGTDTVLRLCAKLKVEFLLGLSKNPRLQKLSWATQLEVALKDFLAGQSAREFAEFDYQAGSWDKAQRVVVKAEMTDNETNPRYVVTGDRTLGAEETYLLYCGRGEHENRIKELKLDLDSGRTSCHAFLANQFRLLLHGAAAVLMCVLQQAAVGTQWARAQAGTLRVRLLKVGARVIESCRRVVFHLSSSFPEQETWFHIHARLSQAPQGAFT